MIALAFILSEMGTHGRVLRRGVICFHRIMLAVVLRTECRHVKGRSRETYWNNPSER